MKKLLLLLLAVLMIFAVSGCEKEVTEEAVEPIEQLPSWSISLEGKTIYSSGFGKLEDLDSIAIGDSTYEGISIERLYEESSAELEDMDIVTVFTSDSKAYFCMPSKGGYILIKKDGEYIDAPLYCAGEPSELMGEIVKIEHGVGIG